MIVKFLKKLKSLRSENGEQALTLRRRLFVFLLILTITLLSGVLCVLFAAGAVLPGADYTHKLIERELGIFSSRVEKQYGEASAQAVRMSLSVSDSLCSRLKLEGLNAAELGKRPDLLEKLLGEQIDSMLRALENTESSGVFIVLNATVNPIIPAAEYSRAGVYIRRLEPGAAGAGTENKLLLRGFSSFTENNGLYMQAKWDLEFDIRGRRFYSEPQKVHNEMPDLPLSRLVYWTCEGALPAQTENVMLCSVPLLDENGNTFGVCGFEIGQMNFMLKNDPGQIEYDRLVCIFSKEDNGVFDIKNALFSGNSAVYRALLSDIDIRRGEKTDIFHTYTQAGGEKLAGLDGSIRLYPDDSPFNTQNFAALTAIPKADLSAAFARRTLAITVIMFLLLIIGAAASFLLSRRYVKPITDSLLRAQSATDETPKTNIREIDSLIEKLMSLRTSAASADDLFGVFADNIKTLTPTELVIYKMHAEKKTGDEIMACLCIAPGTLKNHNRHIFAKLNVSSKDELMLYAELMNKCGLLPAIDSNSDNGAN